ncbi:OmpA family protein [Frankia sp. CNm7]|uniref:OmpA family protein n=1 Tax=Frankia nepalensis TaxID=1836974 RepID=A0A937UM71_9ACTN|nr:OmpA family protein [Frankia nepalensis]MBL7500091.1 OmpA family protein [Frankia nepalensis]MBL7512452.1 OmpA family protein [Frankia nepalensis]MBL7523745.1 OmpA family protein [Frankia nepalensis]MBL7628589.1 OmpA family protein [Frankia nepalensis]
MVRKIAVPALAAITAGLVFAGGCGGSSGSDRDASPAPSGPSAATTTAEPTPSTAPEDSSTEALPPGAQPGLHDFNDDGTPDPTCGTQDFGAGLVLRLLCGDFSGYAHTPEDGTRLVADSLYRLPGPDNVDLTGISGENLAAIDEAGREVFILIFNSDALFDTGSDVIGSTDSLDATINLINAHYAEGDIQVRGHTDATGTASGNQALSERRAGAVQSYLLGHGVRAATVTSVGLGSAHPLAEEANPDGSPDPEGQRFNRRVEIVVRLAQ